jgi:hypothetical protein
MFQILKKKKKKTRIFGVKHVCPNAKHTTRLVPHEKQHGIERVTIRGNK